MSDGDDGFQPVNSRKKRTRKNRKNVVAVKTVDDHLRSLDEKRLHLADNTAFMADFNAAVDQIEGVDKTQHIRCLALGAPTDWLCAYAAMYQLALLQLLAEKLGIGMENITTWDPVYTTEDREVFDKLEIKVDESEDEDIENCLFYMPHAPMTLTNEILSRGRRKRLVMIGNELTDFNTRITDDDMKDKYPHLYDAIQSIDGGDWQSIRVPEKHSTKQQYSQAFNGLSITLNWARDRDGDIVEKLDKITLDG